jgi:hypothetical protein
MNLCLIFTCACYYEKANVKKSIRIQTGSYALVFKPLPRPGRGTWFKQISERQKANVLKVRIKPLLHWQMKLKESKCCG